VINPLPVAYNVTGGADSAQAVQSGVSKSVLIVGVNYQFWNGTAVVARPMAYRLLMRFGMKLLRYLYSYCNQSLLLLVKQYAEQRISSGESFANQLIRSRWWAAIVQAAQC